MKSFKIFIVAVITFGSAYAQSYHVPNQHTKQHGDLISIQNESIFKVEDGAKLEDQSWLDALKDYFYPSAKFSYVMSPNLEKPNMVATYSLSSGNSLTKTTEIWNGYSAKKIAEDAYKLKMDKDRLAIVSTQQIIQNVMGSRRASDKITMFLLPKDSKSVSWRETVNGETSNCSAKFVYISFT